MGDKRLSIGLAVLGLLCYGVLGHTRVRYPRRSKTKTRGPRLRIHIHEGLCEMDGGR